MRNREEKKKCKGQESTIGKIIYGFLLFLPLLAIGVTCGYAMFNKNAYQSYKGTINQVLEPIDSIYDINANEYGNIFKFDNVNNTQLSNPITFRYTYIEYLGGNLTLDEIDKLSQSNQMLLYWANPTRTIQYAVNGTSTYLDLRYKQFQFKVSDLSYVNGSFDEFKQYLYYYNLDNLDTLDNVFYYSIDKVQQSPLFNWAENSIIYTTTSNTCNALSITTPFIPLLMSYWLIISVIYFLYDIALMLVWIVHRKIHELQESI